MRDQGRFGRSRLFMSRQKVDVERVFWVGIGVCLKGIVVSVLEFACGAQSLCFLMGAGAAERREATVSDEVQLHGFHESCPHMPHLDMGLFIVVLRKLVSMPQPGSPPSSFTFVEAAWEGC